MWRCGKLNFRRCQCPFNVHHAVVIDDYTPVRYPSRWKRAGVLIEPKMCLVSIRCWSSPTDPLLKIGVGSVYLSEQSVDRIRGALSFRSSLSEFERLRHLEEEQEQLNSSLVALTTHFAQVQFRLKQIVNASQEEKEASSRCLQIPVASTHTRTTREMQLKKKMKLLVRWCKLPTG